MQVLLSEYQLDILRKCLKERVLIDTLESLPKTLNSTYERILLQIPEEYQHNTYVIFCLLTCAFRHVAPEEAADIVAVNLELKSFDKRDRLYNPSAILKFCPSLLVVSPVHAISDLLESNWHLDLRKLLLLT